MGLRYLAVVAALIAAAWTSARAQDKPPVIARAEQCLKDNVDRIVAADPSLASAADFLVNYRCAPEIAAAARYQRNLALAKVYNSMVRLKPPNGANSATTPSVSPESVDPETGEIIVHRPPPAAIHGSASLDIYQIEPATEGLMSSLVPVTLRKLAGDLVLEARERRLAKGQ